MTKKNTQNLTYKKSGLTYIHSITANSVEKTHLYGANQKSHVLVVERQVIDRFFVQVVSYVCTTMAMIEN